MIRTTEYIRGPIFSEHCSIEDRMGLFILQSLSVKCIAEGKFKIQFCGFDIELFETPKSNLVSKFESKFQYIWRVAIKSNDEFVFIKVAHHRNEMRVSQAIRYSSLDFLHSVDLMLKMSQ